MDYNQFIYTFYFIKNWAIKFVMVNSHTKLANEHKWACHHMTQTHLLIMNLKIGFTSITE